ncbi:MAG: CPBP family intramembrane glutamic endopeptidase [Sphingomicrobium sp.]
MSGGQITTDDYQSRARRIIEFPLTAMMLGFAAIMGPAGLLAGFFEKTLPASGATALVGQLIVAAVILASYKLVAPHLGSTPHDDLSGPGSIRQLGNGLGVGALLFALVVAVAAILGVYRLEGVGDASNLAASLVRDGIFPAVAEEVIFRAILFRWLEEFAGTWAALVLSSALFGLSHMDNPSADMISTVGIMLEGGILLGAAYMLTRRLWFPMGIHASWNLTQGEVFDIPISGNDAHGLLEAKLHGPALLTGGGFGLEASIIGITIGTAAGFGILWLAVRRGQLVHPWWTRPDPVTEP